MQLHVHRARTALQPSFHEIAAARLAALCDAIHFDHAGSRAAGGALDAFLHGWGDQPVGPAPRWRPDITDDHSPFELSLAFTGTAIELRLLAEAQADRPELPALWEAAGALSRRLERKHGAGLGRLRAVEDLFAPVDPAARFAAWHAVNLSGAGRADYKICFSFVGPGTTPAAATLHFPVRAYAADDRAALACVLPYLGGDDRRRYARVLAALAARRLEDGVGLQTYLSMRRHAGQLRVTVYLSPELYRVMPPRDGEQLQ